MNILRVGEKLASTWSTRLATGGLALALLTGPVLGTPFYPQDKETEKAAKEAEKAAKQAEKSAKQADRLAREAERLTRQNRYGAHNFSGYRVDWDQGVFLGVFPETVTESKANELGMKKSQGVYLQNVVPNSPADKAGLKRGDVITELNGQTVVNHEHFRTLLSKCEQGKSIKLEIFRDKKNQTLTVTPEKWSERKPFAYSFTPEGGRVHIDRDQIRKQVEEAREQSLEALKNKDWAFSFYGNERGRLGIRTQELSRQLADFFNAKDGGLLVTEVLSGSVAEKAGLKAGDCITSVNGTPVSNTSTLLHELNKVESGPVTLNILRDKQPMTITATLEKKTEKTGYHLFLGDHGRLGVQAQKLNSQLAASLGVKEGGVLVMEVVSGSAAEKAGLKAGDCITSVNGVAIADSSDLMRELRKVEEGNVTLSIIRDRQPMTITATLEKRSKAFHTNLRIAPKVTLHPMHLNLPAPLPQLDIPAIPEIEFGEALRPVAMALGDNLSELIELENLPEAIEVEVEDAL